MKNWRGKRCFFTPRERCGAVALGFGFVVLTVLSLTGHIG